MSDIDTDDHSGIFTKAEMDETWARLLHQAVFGEGVTTGCEYAEWMAPLCDVYRKHLWGTWNGHEDDVQTELLADCKAAYKAGLAGDFASVDRFVGGYELAQNR